MTQEELDALIMSENSSLEENATTSEEISNDVSQPKEQDLQKTDDDLSAAFVDPKNYKVEANKKWPPPPPTDDHKVVHQLDDVTKDSEVKATQIFDQLDHIGANAEKIIKSIKPLNQYLKNHSEIFKKLSQKFPNVEVFKTSLEETEEILKTINSINDDANDCVDASMQAMDIMQFQDIHRQKIERVINVMRALAQYMNSLFEGKIDDSKRVSSAVYIAGDDKEDMASEDDIEALIASFGKK
ncbi:chemotaxis protein [Helicobacter sp. 12S02232-10]|uniref:chemotaxis protein n=1 Tax=Helicobacter sp. 12S02232-10 TaxID=1476197 RepID=UPI000BA6091A|nr:chemotaxis protein [Helicobacter sp. 12S02232-10]PAF48756.1 chemotaxis protein [Helicobacter sp. 12S02232-10]